METERDIASCTGYGLNLFLYECGGENTLKEIEIDCRGYIRSAGSVMNIEIGEIKPRLYEKQIEKARLQINRALALLRYAAKVIYPELTMINLFGVIYYREGIENLINEHEKTNDGYKSILYQKVS